MAEPRPAPPPRFTRNADVDLAAMIQWFTDFYKSVILLNQRDAGTFTVSEDETTAEANISVPQSDTNYRICVTAVSFTGAPADGSFTVKSVDKTTSGFTVTLLAAPGTDAAVVFDWQIQR